MNYIDRIAMNLSSKLKFDIWEADDIKQEIYFLMLEAVKEYDPKRGDEYRFYFNFVKKRLINFKRDNYATNVFRKNIADACTLEGDIIEEHDNFLKKYQDLIDNRIDVNFRADYLRYKEGVKLPHKRKVAVLEHIKEIVQRAQINEEIKNDE